MLNDSTRAARLPHAPGRYADDPAAGERSAGYQIHTISSRLDDASNSSIRASSIQWYPRRPIAYGPDGVGRTITLCPADRPVATMNVVTHPAKTSPSATSVAFPQESRRMWTGCE